MLTEKKYIEKYMDILTLIFKWTYLIFILLFDNSIIYDTLLTKILSKIIIIIGCIVLIWRMLNIKECIKYPYVKFFVLFLATFLVTILFNYRYGYIFMLK